MRAFLLRLRHEERQTLGELVLYDELAPVYSVATLELPWVGNLRNTSRIPHGTYPVVPRESEKYGKHYHVLGVVDRDLILIHAGNFHHQTKGCVLVGRAQCFADLNQDGLLDVTQSRASLRRLHDHAPDGFTLTVVD